MKLYLAARYSSKEKIKSYAEILRADGHVITSRWLREKYSPTTGLKEVTPRFCREHAAIDFADIRAGKGFVVFTVDPEKATKRGGRHVETGYALAKNKKVYVIGPYENIFHYLPGVKQFATFEEFRRYLNGRN